MADYPAKSVTVAKIFRPACNIPGCGWRGGEYGTYAEANADRQRHLDGHNAGRIGSDGQASDG